METALSLREGYWEDFTLGESDVEFLYNYLLEAENPMATDDLLKALVSQRISQEKLAQEQLRSMAGEIYQPKGAYQTDQMLLIPALQWRKAKVVGVRPGKNPETGDFQVIQVAFQDGELREFASELADHKLNEPIELTIEDPGLDLDVVLEEYGEDLVATLEEELANQPDFVRIAGNWFSRALLVDITAGHLNLAEAVLDMSGGGPLPTQHLIEQVGITSNASPKLLDFSFNWALQNDPRFDEVGPSGEVLWFLNRLEPPEVLSPPVFLRYSGIEYDRSALNQQMLELERDLDDELSPLPARPTQKEDVEIRLIYPHWRSGTLPVSSRVRNLFPTAFESPRIQFLLVDGDTGEKFPAWVVREKRYVFGLKNWYHQRGLIPGSIVHVRRGANPGEVILKTDSRRSSRDWMRTVLVGSDGGVVFAMLKQMVNSPFDDRMAISIPDVDALDETWTRSSKDQTTLEKMVVSMVRELSKLSPQGHCHAIELYAAVNIVRRVPPGPMLAMLASQPALVHLGDLHFRLAETDGSS